MHCHATFVYGEQLCAVYTDSRESGRVHQTPTEDHQTTICIKFLDSPLRTYVNM